MKRDFEDLVAKLREQPTPRSLAGLEARVWGAIALRQRDLPATAIWGWRSATAALLLTVGIMAQGARAAHASAELDLFTSRAALAPSTLLGEDR